MSSPCRQSNMDGYEDAAHYSGRSIPGMMHDGKFEKGSIAGVSNLFETACQFNFSGVLHMPLYTTYNEIIHVIY